MRFAILLMLAALLVAAMVQAERGEPPANQVLIDGMRYTPPKLTITLGQTVTWKNTDERDHTVRADDGNFDSGTIGSGGTFQHRFTRAGIYHYSCAFHPREKGEIVVE